MSDGKRTRACYLIIGAILGMVILELFMSVVFNTSITALASRSSILYEADSSMEYVRTAIVTELSGHRHHIAELHTMLYPSWSYVNSLALLPLRQLLTHPQINWNPDTPTVAVKLDLIIFCEPISCNKVPLECFPLSLLHSLHRTLWNAEFRRMKPSCFYYALDEEYEQRALKQHYAFLASLLFLTEAPFASIVNYYDYILRTDCDAFITPLALLWRPVSGDGNIGLPAAFGANYIGTNFTNLRLEKVARKLHLKHAGLHSMQSTWYVQSDIFMELVRYAVNLTVHFVTQEFTENVCSEMMESDGMQCKWPEWYRGVSSLYGSNLAVNHVLFGKMIQYKELYNVEINEWKTTKLDCWDDQPLTQTVQMHVVLGKAEILDKIQSVRSAQGLSDLCMDYEELHLRKFGSISESSGVLNYAANIVGHGLRDVCASIMIPYA